LSKRECPLGVKLTDSDDSYHTANPFTNLTNIVSALTATVQLDVYSLSRESLQRMLPAAPTIAPPKDERQFQYRFSMAYVRALPEAQRPVEREVFGKFQKFQQPSDRPGPYPVAQLSQWRNTGAFGGPACENVELRKVGDEKWGSWADIVG